MSILRSRTAFIVASFVYLWYLRWGTSKNIDYPKSDKRDITVYSNAFEPEVNEDIQTTDSENPRIPHNFHFVFISGINDTNGIPKIYRHNVLSFLQFNPNWTFYFWSDVSGRALIEARHPALLSTYDHYRRDYLKADALRYVLLYEFGGVYADLDMRCMRPLDRATMKHACILTPEPFEHSAILYQMPYLFSNSLILCRPKHPFLKQVIDSLPETGNLMMMTNLDSAFLTKQYNKYNKLTPNTSFSPKQPNSNSPYFYQEAFGEYHNDAIYVANTKYFMSSFDSGANSYFQATCNITRDPVNKIIENGCSLWQKRNTCGGNKQNRFSFTDRIWDRMSPVTNSSELIPVQSVIPQIIQYNVSSEITA